MGACDARVREQYASKTCDRGKRTCALCLLSAHDGFREQDGDTTYDEGRGRVCEEHNVEVQEELVGLGRHILCVRADLYVRVEHL